MEQMAHDSLVTEDSDPPLEFQESTALTLNVKTVI